MNVKAWNRSVDLKNPRFVVIQVFEDSEVLKEAVREFALKNQLRLWFDKNCKEKIEVRCQLANSTHFGYMLVKSKNKVQLYLSRLCRTSTSVLQYKPTTTSLIIELQLRSQKICWLMKVGLGLSF